METFQLQKFYINDKQICMRNILQPESEMFKMILLILSEIPEYLHIHIGM